MFYLSVFGTLVFSQFRCNFHAFLAFNFYILLNGEDCPAKGSISLLHAHPRRNKFLKNKKKMLLLICYPFVRQLNDLG
jgi:hypothetical protein